MKKAIKLKLADLFAGIGGIRLGFESTNLVETVFSSEIDKHASTTYELNHLDKPSGDITTIKENDIPNIDILAGGFPCQAFSVAGYRKGFSDTRGTLFFDIIRIIEAKMPKVVFLENVKGLVSHDNGKTFEIITKTLKDLGYSIFWKILNSCDFGNLPQNRERIYIVCFRSDLNIEKFSFPHEIKRTVSLHSLLEKTKVADKYYYRKESAIYDKLATTVTKKDSVYQYRRYYVRENKSGVCPTLTANMGTGGHNVPIILDDFGIRKLTPRECLRIQGFPDTFKKPDMSDSQIYKQAGNSVSLPVIQRIAEQIVKALGKGTSA